MTKAEFIDAAWCESRRRHAITKQEVEDVISVAFGLLREKLGRARGPAAPGKTIRSFSWPGFGTFKVKVRAARLVHYPDGSICPLPQRRRVVFREAPDLLHLLDR
ncbi:MAG: HU family DNA-binding protein [Candidatus Eisenbacteria bacterium]